MFTSQFRYSVKSSGVEGGFVIPNTKGLLKKKRLIR